MESVKMKSACLTTVLFALQGAAMSYPKIVESKDVKFVELAYSIVGDRSSLKLKGFIFHSALAVLKAEIKQESDGTLVLIYLTPANKSNSGRFDLDVPIYANDTKVFFGSTKAQIWPQAK